MSDSGKILSCPSARPEMAHSVVFGVVTPGGERSAPERRVAYLEKTLPVTPELLGLTAPVDPTEVLRFAAPCAQHKCQHFDGSDCSLARRTVEYVMPVVRRLPKCAIRPTCLWFSQEGAAACVRCPLIVTESFQATPEVLRASAPPEKRETAQTVAG